MKGRVVSRISACKDPSRWHGVVIDWLDRQRKRLDKERRKSGLPKLKRCLAKNDPLAGPPPELSRRFIRELPMYLELALAEHSVQHAGARNSPEHVLRLAAAVSGLCRVHRAREGRKRAPDRGSDAGTCGCRAG